MSAERHSLFYKRRANCNTTEIQHMQGDRKSQTVWCLMNRR